MMNLAQNVKITRALNAVAAGQTAQNGAVIDMANFEGVVFLAAFGTLDAGAVTGLKAQQGLQANLSDAADLAGAALAIADTADNAGLSSPDAGGGQIVNSRGGNGALSEDGGGGSPVPRSNRFSREEAAFDQATFRFSPDAIASSTAPARDLVTLVSGSGRSAKSGVQSGGHYVVISVPDGQADKWAEQYVARQPLERLALTMPRNPSPNQVLKTYQRAAVLAGGGGRVIVNVGHGDDPETINPDKDGWAELAPDGKFVIGGPNLKSTVNVFYDVRLIDVGLPQLEYDRQHPDEPECKKRFANWQVYNDIGNALRSAGVYKVVMLTCRIGNVIDFIRKVANDWGVVVEAYKDGVWLNEMPSGRVRMYLNSDPDGTGTNVPLGEEELPLATELNSYRAGPPVSGSGSGASNPTNPAARLRHKGSQDIRQ